MTARAVLVGAVLALAALVATAPPARALEPRTPLEAYLLGLEAEVVTADLPEALALFREAARGPAGDVRTSALIAVARVLLRQEDFKAFSTAMSAVPGPRALTPPQSAEVARLKKVRDELGREPKRPAPSPAPARALHDVTLTDVPLEDACASLSALYGGTLIAAEGAPQRVSLHLRGVSFSQALLALAFQAGVDARRAGGIHYVGPARRLAAFFPSPPAVSAAELFAADAVPRPITPAASVSLKLQSQPVPEAVRRLVEGFGVNIVAATTSEKVSLDLSRVGLDGALRSIASQLSWEIRRVNDMFFLGPGTQLAVYFPGFERRYVRLKHVSAGEIYDEVQQFLEKEHVRLARAEVDIVGNALILEGDKRDLDKLERFLGQEDVAQRSIGFELWMKDTAAAKPAESPRKRMRMLAGQAGIVTLESEAPTDAPAGTGSGNAPPAPALLQLMVELTPHVKPAGAVALDVSWRLTTSRAGAIVDVQEGAAKPVASGDQPLEVPILQSLALVLRLAE